MSKWACWIEPVPDWFEGDGRREREGGREGRREKFTGRQKGVFVVFFNHTVILKI